jgi:hypothetical protein
VKSSVVELFNGEQKVSILIFGNGARNKSNFREMFAYQQGDARRT